MSKHFIIKCPFRARAQCHPGLLLVYLAFIGAANFAQVQGEEPSTVMEAVISEGYERIAVEASADQRVNVPRGMRKTRKSKAQRRAKRVAQQVPHVDANTTASKGGLQLNGSFSMTWGDWVIVQGNGSLQMTLNEHAKRSLNLAATESIDQSVEMANNYLGVLKQVPETLRTTRDILETLSDPKVQENLRQVQQLLQMYQTVSGGSPEKK